MSKTLASTSAHTPTKSAPASSPKNYDSNPSGIVVGLTLGMAWQLAVTVLVPVVGGHFIDTRLHPNGAPVFTLGGLTLAIVGMIIVVRRTLKELNKYMKNHESPIASTGDKLDD